MLHHNAGRVENMGIRMDAHRALSHELVNVRIGTRGVHQLRLRNNAQQVVAVHDGEMPHAVLHEQPESMLNRVVASERRGGRAKCILNFHGHEDGSHAGCGPAKRILSGA